MLSKGWRHNQVISVMGIMGGPLLMLLCYYVKPFVRGFLELLFYVCFMWSSWLLFLEVLHHKLYTCQPPLADIKEEDLWVGRICCLITAYIFSLHHQSHHYWSAWDSNELVRYGYENITYDVLIALIKTVPKSITSVMELWSYAVLH